MITRFQADAIVRRLIVGWHLEAGDMTPDQADAAIKLVMVGWRSEAGQKRRCRYCGMTMKGPALHSPQGGVYHIGCASASGQERLSRNQRRCNGHAAQA